MFQRNVCMKKNSISRRVLIGSLLVMLLIGMLLIGYSLFSRHAVLSQAEENNRIYAELLSGQLNRSLSELHEYLNNLYYVDDLFFRLSRTEGPGGRYLLIQEINQQAKGYVNLFPYEILFYITSSSSRAPVISTLSSDVNSLELSDYLHSLADIPDGAAKTYEEIRIGGELFLSLRYQKNEIKMGLLVRTGTLLSSIQHSRDLSNTSIVLQTPSGETAAENDTEPQTPSDRRSVQSACALTEAPLTVSVRIPEDQLIGKLSVLRWLSLALILIAAVTFFSYYFYQRGKILSPLRELRETLEKLDPNDADTYLNPNAGTTELSDVYRTINTYIDHLTALRTQTYEERLNRQNIEMQFLQLQLRPHFFLNSMKGIYALAENREYQEIQEYVLCLSQHFRFLLYDTTRCIELKKELMHTQNYIQMQRIALHKPDISCTLQMNGVNENTPVPPLLLQTFVENAIKYALVPEKPLAIHIRVQLAEMDDERSMLNFSIRDNGPGYSEEILEEMSADEASFFRQHKGFGNLKRRLGLIYSEEAEIYLYNDPMGGAAVEILLPQTPKEETA